MKFYDFYKKYGIYCVLLTVCILLSFTAPNFLSWNNMLNILRQCSVFGIVVVGVSLVTIAGGSDLSVGGQVAVDGIFAAILMVNRGLPIWLTVLATMVLGIIFGLINGLICVKFGIAPLIVTLGTMLVLNGLAYIISGGYAIFGMPETFKILGQGHVGVIPVPVIIFFIIVIIGAVLLNKTYLGRYIYAMGGNTNASYLAGIKVEKMRIFTYMLCGWLTSIAALIMLSRTNSAQPSAGSSYPFDCMTACCLGGVSVAGGEGGVSGAIMGVLIIGILNNGLQLMNCDSNLISCIKGVVLLVAVAIDSRQKMLMKS